MPLASRTITPCQRKIRCVWTLGGSDMPPDARTTVTPPRWSTSSATGLATPNLPTKPGWPGWPVVHPLGGESQANGNPRPPATSVAHAAFGGVTEHRVLTPPGGRFAAGPGPELVHAPRTSAMASAAAGG